MKKRKDGRWAKYITINKKRVVFYSYASTEKAAEKDIQQQLITYSDKQEHHLFKDVANKWITDYYEQHGISNSLNGVQGAYNRVLKYFGDCNVEDIKAQDVSAFINELAYMRFARKTVSNHKSILNQIMRLSVVLGYIDYNPTTDITVPKKLPKTRRKLPTTEDIKKVASHWQDFDLFGYMLLHTGLRRSEALALEYEDIYDGKIHVNKVARFTGNRIDIVNQTKTDAGEREVIVLKALQDKLPNGKGRIFNTITSKKRFVTEWGNYIKRYELDLTPHQLRHAYATMLFEAGIEDKVAQQLMGHSDISLTREIYTHIRETKLESAKSKLDNFEW